MPNTQSQRSFRVEPAGEDDWADVEDAVVRGAWESLPPDRRGEVPIETVRESFAHEAEGLRSPDAPSHQAFLARAPDGQAAGAAIVVAMRAGFDRHPIGLVMEVSVGEAYRGQGVGRLLLEAAEQWARQLGLGEMQIHLSPHKVPGPQLAEELGYRVDKVQLSKRLTGA